MKKSLINNIFKYTLNLLLQNDRNFLLSINSFQDAPDQRDTLIIHLKVKDLDDTIPIFKNSDSANMKETYKGKQY